MKSTLKLLPTLFVTVVMSSLAPVVLCGLVLAFCSLLWLFPGVTASILRDGLNEFLQVFGNGNAVDGILTIAITCGFVGGMFETFNFYYYQNNS